MSGTPVPETGTAVLPPFEVTARPTEEKPGALGAKRTTIAWLAPPTRPNDPPETIVNGNGTDALPVSVPPPAFRTMKVRSIDPPTTTLLKSTDPVGETVRDAVARMKVAVTVASALRFTVQVPVPLQTLPFQP